MKPWRRWMWNHYLKLDMLSRDVEERAEERGAVMTVAAMQYVRKIIDRVLGPLLGFKCG